MTGKKGVYCVSQFIECICTFQSNFITEKSSENAENGTDDISKLFSQNVTCNNSAKQRMQSLPEYIQCFGLQYCLF